MTVAELESRMSAAELREWMAYDRVSPIGPERGDLCAGIVAATVANCHRGKGRAAFKPTDFMPRFAASATSDMASEIKAAFATLPRADKGGGR